MRLRPSLVWFEWPRGDSFAGNFEIQINKFCLCWVTVNFPATRLQSKLLHLRTLRLLREQIIKSLRKSKELNMFFFRGVLPTLSSLYKQSERYIFVLSQPIDTYGSPMIMRLFQMKWNNSSLVMFCECLEPPAQTTSSISKLCLPQWNLVHTF